MTRDRPWEWKDYIVIRGENFSNGRVTVTYRIRCTHAIQCGGYTSGSKMSKSVGMHAFLKHWEAKHGDASQRG